MPDFFLLVPSPGTTLMYITLYTHCETNSTPSLRGFHRYGLTLLRAKILLWNITYDWKAAYGTQIVFGILTSKKNSEEQYYFKGCYLGPNKPPKKVLIRLGLVNRKQF